MKISNYVFDDAKHACADTLYVCLILNRPIDMSVFDRVRSFNSLFICADGGANRLFAIRDSYSDQINPHAIVGDLDSLHDNVREHYSKLGTNIVLKSSQDDTDLEKSIEYLISNEDFFKNGTKIYSSVRVTILGGFGGRLDQTLSNLSNLVKINEKLKGLSSISSFTV